MTVAQARRAIGEAGSARITGLFEADLTRMRRSGACEVFARMWRGSTLPGHNPRAVPPVPLTVVATGPVWTAPGVISTRKSEYQDAPYVRINTPPAWNTRVAHRGFAVIPGLPTAAVLEWDTDQQRPALTRTVALAWHFDSGICGWCAWSRDVVRGVAWTDPDRPELLQAAAHHRA